MNFDFLYHDYTLVITIFAAVFGMAYPLILQAIDRIDEKYTSSVLATDLRKRWQFRAFNVLIVACIICVAVLAYALKYIGDIQWKYVLVSAAVFLIVMLMVDVVLLFHQIITYYSPNELFAQLKRSENKKDANALLDLAKFASKTDDFMLHVNCLSVIAHFFYEEQKKAPNDKPVEYSPELYDILSKVAKQIGDTSLTDDRYNYIGIACAVYNHSSEGGISPNTFQRMWEMVNRAAKAGNIGWLIDYWTYADQYYRFYQLNSQTPMARKNLREFYCYHVMMGGLLLYFNRTDCVRHIMHFSQSQPEKFELIPGTMSKVFEMVAYVEDKRDKPFGLYQRYQFMGLEKGAKIDDAIAGFAYQYLALLFLRLWTYNDYNINYANPLSVPFAFDENIEVNKKMISCVERIKREVARWYMKGTLPDLGLFRLPKEDEANDKLDEYINVLRRKITEIEDRDDVDEGKVKKIKDEIIVSNANYYSPLPMMEEGAVINKSLYKTLSTPVVITNRIDKTFITKGSLQELGNFGSCLVTELNYNMLGKYLEVACAMMPCDLSYNIRQKDLLEAIDRMKLPEDYIVVEIGNALNLYELKKKLTYNDNQHSYQGNTILDMGLTGFSPRLWVIKGSELPFIDIIETGNTGSDCVEIDSNNHLYSNIDFLKPPFDVQLVQSMVVYALKKHSISCIINVTFDHSDKRYDLDKIAEIQN